MWGFLGGFGNKIINKAIITTNKRWLSLHEYVAMNILSKYDIPTPKFVTAETSQEVLEAATNLHKLTGVEDVVIKAQVLAGGRGRGLFSSGLRGGVKIVYNAEEAKDTSEQMLNKVIVTKQTGPKGVVCNKVIICERLYSRRESYFAILLNRKTNNATAIACAEGGVNIEEMAASYPELLLTKSLPSNGAMGEEMALEIARFMKFDEDHLAQTMPMLINLSRLFHECDCTLLEINPISLDIKGNVYAMDCKMLVDDNAEFRQKEIFAMRDISEQDSREQQAAQHNINYIGLDGNIGCLVNGAGLAMSTMDIISFHNGNAANFLDIGGGATANQVMEALRIITSDSQVRAVLVNIFGGIMRCDVIAKGIIDAVTGLNLKVPIVVRLQGTKLQEAQAMIFQSHLKILPCNDLDMAARMVVNLANIVQIAKDSALDVSFELPI